MNTQDRNCTYKDSGSNQSSPNLKKAFTSGGNYKYQLLAGCDEDTRAAFLHEIVVITFIIVVIDGVAVNHNLFFGGSLFLALLRVLASG